jgi:hypothetical protein
MNNVGLRMVYNGLQWFMVPVWEGDTLVASDDAVVDGEDGLGVHSHPRNLHKPTFSIWFQPSVSTFSHYLHI